MSLLATGLRAWVVQRVTAVYLAGFSLFLLLYFIGWAPGSYREWVSWLASPPILVAFSIAVFSLILHSWVGVRNIIMDYVAHDGLRLLLLVVLGLSLAGLGMWLFKVLLGVTV